MPYQCDPCVCPEQHYRDSMSWRKAMITLLCQLIGVQNGSDSNEAYFDPMVEKTSTDITGSFTQAVNLANGTRKVMFDNQTNGDVVVSMNSGNSSHYYVRSYQTLTLDMPPGLTTTADIYLKDGTVVATSGSFYIYAMR